MSKIAQSAVDHQLAANRKSGFIGSVKFLRRRIQGGRIRSGDGDPSALVQKMHRCFQGDPAGTPVMRARLPCNLSIESPRPNEALNAGCESTAKVRQTLERGSRVLIHLVRAQMEQFGGGLPRQCDQDAQYKAAAKLGREA